MKRIILFSVGALSLALFSFVSPKNNGVTRLDKYLYNIAPVAKFTPQDKADGLAAIKSKYHITDFSKCAGTNLGLSPLDNNPSAKGAFVEWAVWVEFCLNKCIYWDSIVGPDEDPDASTLNRIFTKYADQP